MNQLTICSRNRSRAESPFGNSSWAGSLLLVLLIAAILIFNFFFIWLRSEWRPVHASPSWKLIFLRMRSVPVGLLVDTALRPSNRGWRWTIDDLSTHFLAGGNAVMVIQALMRRARPGFIGFRPGLCHRPGHQRHRQNWCWRPSKLPSTEG